MIWRRLGIGDWRLNQSPIPNLVPDKLFDCRPDLITQLLNHDSDVWRLFGALLPLEEEADQDEAETGDG